MSVVTVLISDGELQVVSIDFDQTRSPSDRIQRRSRIILQYFDLRNDKNI